MRPKGPKSEAQKAESGNWVLGEGAYSPSVIGAVRAPPVGLENVVLVHFWASIIK